MGFLNLRKKESFLGVDLGTTSIKLVEIENKGGIPTLLTYGYAEKAVGDFIKGESEEARKNAVELLKKLYKKSGAKSHKVYGALPNFAVFNSIINLPVMSKKELTSAIQWEAKKFIPLPIEDVILDWKIVEQFTNNHQEVDSDGKTKMINRRDYKILLIAASKKLVQKFIDIFREADLQLLSLETESFAMARSLITKDERVVMIVDSSALTTDIIILEKGIPYISRSIDVGGISLTKTLAERMGLDYEAAEQFKKDAGFKRDEFASQIITQSFQPVINEVQYSLHLYQNQTNKNVEKIILSGGSAYLPGLPEYIAEVLNLKVFIGDPWAKIAYPLELKPALTAVAPRFSVALGLALRGFE